MDATSSDSAIQPRPRRLPPHPLRLRAATVLAAIVLIGTLAYSADLLLHDHGEAPLLSPLMVALLMIGNLIPAIILLVLSARQIAKRRGIRQGFGRGQIHTRLVALFSTIAAIPTLLVVVVASVLVQSGLEFWFSERAKTMLVDTVEIADATLQNEIADVSEEAVFMSGDLVGALSEMDVRSAQFEETLAYQTFVRKLFESAVLRVEDGEVEVLSSVHEYEGMIDREQILSAVEQLSPNVPVTVEQPNRIALVTEMPQVENGYLFVARQLDEFLVSNIDRADNVRQGYDDIIAKSRSNQLRFNAALLFGSLLIVALASFAALKLADRIARPVGQLVGAAGRVEEGDFTARVPPQPGDDEIATLATAFNRMTSRIEEQTGALLSANDQLDLRRAFIEAVLGSVTAGVIAIDEDHRIQLINRSAAMLMGDEDENLEGADLRQVSPELEEYLSSSSPEATVELQTQGGIRTLAIKRVRYEDGTVLTFDDVTEQLSDQRRAAWSDIARRIAHEIKNPLTPIQLAAERLQRRYGEALSEDDDTFERLTGTIVRQVGDLRRMVDEFSNFARMPKPSFRREDLHDIARAALFLHEVAHPGIAFSISPATGPVPMVCDRRQLAQALTNIVKNAVEAIEARRKQGDSHAEGDRIDLSIEQGKNEITVALTDTGVGLPQERERLTEPYMTTRVRGTGLGLAIVKKIVEEHDGQIAFLDREGGGTHVRIIFDTEKLGERDDGSPGSPLTRSGDDQEYDEDPQ